MNKRLNCNIAATQGIDSALVDHYDREPANSWGPSLFLPLLPVIYGIIECPSLLLPFSLYQNLPTALVGMQCAAV